MFQTSGPGREIINGEKKIRDGRHLLDLTGTESIGIQSASHFFFKWTKKLFLYSWTIFSIKSISSRKVISIHHNFPMIFMEPTAFLPFKSIFLFSLGQPIIWCNHDHWVITEGGTDSFGKKMINLFHYISFFPPFFRWNVLIGSLTRSKFL